MYRLITTLTFLGLLTACIQDEPIKIAPNTTPANLNDGWQISTPEAEQVNSLLLQKAIDYFFSEQYLVNSKGLLIAKNGKLILEAYNKETKDRDQLQNIKSVTKSVTSIVTGIAIQDGVIDANLNRTIYSYIPENFDNNEEKRNITLEHCLRMSTGLEDPIYAISVVLPGNSVSSCLGVNLTHTPGTTHAYNNGSANIIGGVISKASGTTYENYVKEKLFKPLNITNYHWVKHQDGRVNAAFDLYLLPRDMLKFGQFCLQNGFWNNQQLLPMGWIAQSTQPLEDGFDGKFGYHWWIDTKHNGFYANGHGGQRVFVFPQQNLVIVHIAEPSTDDTNLNEIPVLLDLIMAAM
ncbi:MAG TPA: hypothetical protein DCS93_19715 [Microscillaceae bacterium]|nr:hypothetical protein [Microscillaceae bacterium]